MSKIIESSSDKVDAMKNLFEEQRNLWGRKIKKLTRWMKIPDKLTTLEITIRNEIMVISEEKAKLLEALISITKLVRKKKAEVMVEIKTNNDFKMKNQTEQNILIEDALCEYIERQELLEMQIDFLDKTFANLKDISWGISHYIDLMKQGVE